MRIECDYCLSVYESDDTEDEEVARCPFCASRPNRTTAREFQASSPLRERVTTTPFGLASDAPPKPSRTSIICPPPSLDEPPRLRAETPAYLPVAQRVADAERRRAIADTERERAAAKRAAGGDSPSAEETSAPGDRHETPGALPGIEPPATSPIERRRPTFEFDLPQVPPSAPSWKAIPPLPPVSVSPPQADHRVPRDTDRPFVRSDHSLPSPPSRARKAAVWIPFALGAIGAAFAIRGFLASPGDTRETKMTAPVSVASHLAALDEAVAQGDLDRAVTALDRAMHVAPRDPAVLLARAKLAVERADVAWIIHKSTPDAVSDGANRDDFVRTAGEARSAAEEAFRAQPLSDDARRTLVNALRIFGETDRSREVASGLRDQTSPESLYALATLDLATRDTPAGATAARLRQNTSVGGLPGRARAALVYALVRAGQLDDADRELDRLALLARPHPAMASLRALVDASRAALPTPAPAPKRAKAASKPCPDDLKSRHRDAHAIVKEAVNARCRGDVAGARKLYQSILDVTPDDPEALTGLGDVARQEDDWDAARNFYAEALRSHPTFLPAAIGAADVEWDVGNLPVAQRRYGEIIEAFPNASLPPRVSERANPALRNPQGS
jgi:tetratricopeptide (TPR) repeat protein